MEFAILYILFGMCGLVYMTNNYTTKETVLHENVLFVKDGDMSLSRSRWIMTFILDINVYEEFILKLNKEINDAASLGETISRHYDKPKSEGYLSIFQALRGEIKSLQDVNLEIKNSFADLKSLKKRSRRSLFPFIGSALRFLFGTLSSSDLSDIRSNIGTLARNQQTISHVLEKGLSILNITRLQVAENRQSINSIIDSLHDVDQEIDYITQELGKQIFELEQFVYLFSRLDLAVLGIKTAIQRSLYYFSHLQVQLNALSMQKLSPNTIESKEMKQVLKDIETRLPNSYGLPSDPDKDLWTFYKLLSCSTLMEDNRIIIIVPIPLIDYSKKMELFKVYNMPLPLNTVFMTNNNTQTEMLTYYKLEADYLAINAERTQYMILDQKERDTCHLSFPGLCAIRKPLYQVNLAQMCIVALFMRNKRKVKSSCPTMLQYDKNLPRVQYMNDDMYIIITKTIMHINLACGQDIRTKLSINPPYGFIRVRKQCTATSDKVTLTGVYEHGSMHRVNDKALIMLRQYNFSNLEIWTQLKTSVINQTIRIPEKLKTMGEISVDHLVEDLYQQGQVRPKAERKFPIWVGVMIGLGVLLLLIIGIMAFQKWGYKLISLIRPHAKKGPGSRALTGGHSTCHNEAAECQFSLLDSKEPSTTSLELHSVRTASTHIDASSAMDSVSNSTQSGVAFLPLKQQPKSKK